jgi:rRNA maturation RNase YbeY
MLVRIIINSEVALVYCAICAPLLGIMFNNSLPVVIYALLGGVVGAHGVRQCKDRTTILTAGMKVSVVNFAMALSFQIFSDSLITMQTLYCLIFAVAGGIINAFLVTGTIPLIENLFYYTTDIRLLEQANFDSPILRELMVRAPGTYHHSVLVGNLVESAAESINANPLLARVSAYYHDIGKTSKPFYFIENVGQSDNRHDRLTPSMSALILISHVKEGVELAKEHRLGQPIVDIIRQSHGTGLITYFYQKAKNLAAHEGKGVDEREFRYPGPKPQTREAGLVLLADHVEAASRTLAEPTPARIQGMVQKIINNIFIDGQLDECELTLKNLHEIAKSFNRILAGIYHQRIEYPEPAFKEKEKVNGGKRGVEGSDNELSLAIVGDRSIRRLNRLYLGRDNSTNVISFAMQEGLFAGVNPQILGDVVISAVTCAREAEEGRRSFASRLHFLLLHGILHIAGYDHERSGEAEARRMEEKEREMVSLLEREGLI